MGGHRQRTVLNEPAHTRHLRGRDPTEGPGLVLVGHERRPPTPHALTPHMNNCLTALPERRQTHNSPQTCHTTTYWQSFPQCCGHYAQYGSLDSRGGLAYAQRRRYALRSHATRPRRITSPAAVLMTERTSPSLSRRPQDWWVPPCRPRPHRPPRPSGPN